jgi:hypothetical protein
MPKEILTDASGVALKLTWGEQGYLQLATLSRNPAEFVAWCRQIVEDYDKAVRVIPQDAHSAQGNPIGEQDQDREYLPGAGTQMGMFWTPERWHVNELIKVLRRARNASFGADE